MKGEINKLECVPTTVEDMREVLQELWHEVKPEEWRYLTHRLTCKIEDVLDAQGMQTVHCTLKSQNILKYMRYNCININ
jgi:hypothetical protein